MKRTIALFACLLMLLALPCRALEPLPPASMDAQRTFRIEVLQVTDIEPYEEAFRGFMSTLRDNGIVPEQNLKVNRVKIDFDVENGGFWDRLGVLLRIRQEAMRIAEARPDLVLTIGTPATRYARTVLDDARIPLVFTAVANPLDAGSASLTDGGPGVTGATLYTDMNESMNIVKEIFPSLRRIGMVHTDDENGIAHVEAAKAGGAQVGIAVSSRLVNKRDSIVPSLKELHSHGRGVQMFAVPLDTYYGLRRFEPTLDLSDFGIENRIPVIAFALVQVPGAVLYVGADFGAVGSLSGVQAMKILKKRTKPDVLPILRQEKPTVLIDPRRAAMLGVTLPSSILERKTERDDGFWQIGWGGKAIQD